MSSIPMVRHRAHIGMFGKIPGRGDFISAGLPRSFMDKAEKWIRQGLSEASQNQNWHDAYLSSPIWQFATARGVWDEQAWCGIIMPSVDSIGRNFPLIIAIQSDEISMNLLDKIQNLAQMTLSTDFGDIEDWKKQILLSVDSADDVAKRGFLTPPMGGTFRALTPDYDLIAEHRFMHLEADLFMKLISPTDDLLSGTLAS